MSVVSLGNMVAYLEFIELLGCEFRQAVERTIGRPVRRGRDKLLGLLLLGSTNGWRC